MNAFESFYNGLLIVAQVVDTQTSGPNIVIEPTEPTVQKAVNILKRMDPNYFSGVKKIVLSPATMYYGHVESGPGKDPTVVNVNLNKIKSTNPQDALLSAVTTIAHEVAHVKSFDNEQGFVGGEAPAEAEERKVEQWLKANMNSIKDLL